MAKSSSARGASHHPAFMVSYLTISEKRLHCPSCGKMGLQSWDVVVVIWRLIVAGSMVVMVLNSHR